MLASTIVPPHNDYRRGFFKNIKFYSDPRVCWVWKGSIHHTGYGIHFIKKRQLLAHRYSFEYFVGSIPPRYVVHHSCQTKGCVNPRHLRLISHSEHSRRHSTKSICKNGHPLEGDNIYYNKQGHKSCQVCRNHNRQMWRIRNESR